MGNLLLEIGTEEIPAKFMPPALKQLKELAERKLKEARIECGKITTSGTPRRLVLFIEGLPEKQKDIEEEAKGPSAKVAFDNEGKPSKAAQGFARGQGVDVESLTVKETESGPYVFALKKVAGRPVEQILEEILPQLVLGINFPKPMRWGYSDLKYARPIRWLVALFGSQVIKFQVAEVESGFLSRGHRFLGATEVAINAADDYFELMAENYVIVDPEKRKTMIVEQIEELALKAQGKVEPDEDLLEEIVYLIEYPTALMGGFSEKYLEIPKEAIITPMKEHQRYFPVLNSQGELLAKFITVRNGNQDHLDNVQAGNEKVLEARLADAKFFYDEDLKNPLSQYVERLETIVFQERLGTIAEKVERIKKVVVNVAEIIGVDQGVKERALRAAHLAKADLVTNMVYEFPELQGIMGEKYALASGEDQIVAQAIFEHYLPRHAGDILPQTSEGTLISIADKIDTIAGCFVVGIEPTGSQDPYALRRQALGICNIILAQGLSISLKAIINQGLANYQDKLSFDQNQLTNDIYNFFEQRVRNLLADAGHSYDVIEAIIASGYNNLQETLMRAQALGDLKSTATFASLLNIFTRANNLAKKAEKTVIQEKFLVEQVEKDLYNSLLQVEKEVDKAILAQDYSLALTQVASLEKVIKNFFDGVMVMVEDENIKANRLALLVKIINLVEPIADFAKIVS